MSEKDWKFGDKIISRRPRGEIEGIWLGYASRWQYAPGYEERRAYWVMITEPTRQWPRGYVVEVWWDK